MAKIRIAVQGCCHGELNEIYKTVTRVSSINKIDLVIILGDFQSIRNTHDLQSISIPPKYRKMGDFPKYYYGTLKAPIPTIFIGGNHESMRQLMLLPYGGFVAQNIFYMGYSNIIWFQGVRIGGLSGIWKEWDVETERPSWDFLEGQNWRVNVRSLYHVRKMDFAPLFMIRDNLDIMLSHDWPDGVVYHGDIEKLLKRKPYFRRDINKGELGSPVSWELLRKLRPKWWLSAHLHVKYEAIIKHKDISSEEQCSHTDDRNPDEIELNLDTSADNSEETREVLGNKATLVSENMETKFLALDKCLPGREWFQVIEVEPDTSHPSWKDKSSFYWDPEFISCLKYVQSKHETIRNVSLSELGCEMRNCGEGQGVSRKPVNFDIYKIPHYIDRLKTTERAQTQLFVDRFLSRTSP